MITEEDWKRTDLSDEDYFLYLYDNSTPEECINHEFLEKFFSNDFIYTFEIYSKAYEPHRWVTPISSILKVKDRFFLVEYANGNTEMQEEEYYSVNEVNPPIYTECSMLTMILTNKEDSEISLKTVVDKEIC